MTSETKRTILLFIGSSFVSVATVIISFGLYANRDVNKQVDQKLEQKVDKTQYKIDQDKINCELTENKNQIQEQNKLFLEINKNLGELNGKMDLVIKKKN